MSEFIDRKVATVDIRIEGQRVVVTFPVPITHLDLTAAQAEALATALTSRVRLLKEGKS